MLLRWALEHDIVVIPKSFDRERIAENRAVFHFAFDADDMAALDALDEGLRETAGTTGRGASLGLCLAWRGLAWRGLVWEHDRCELLQRERGSCYRRSELVLGYLDESVQFGL